MNVAEGHYENALARIDNLVQTSTTESAWTIETAARFRFAALYPLGKLEAAEEVTNRAGAYVERPYWQAEWNAKLAMVAAADGDPTPARECLPSLDWEARFFRGLLHAALGENGAAFDVLEGVDRWGYADVIELRYFDPELLGPFRDTPRFDRLIETVEETLAANPTAKL